MIGCGEQDVSTATTLRLSHIATLEWAVLPLAVSSASDIEKPMASDLIGLDLTSPCEAAASLELFQRFNVHTEMKLILILI